LRFLVTDRPFTQLIHRFHFSYFLIFLFSYFLIQQQQQQQQQQLALGLVQLLFIFPSVKGGYYLWFLNFLKIINKIDIINFFNCYKSINYLTIIFSNCRLLIDIDY